MWKFWLFSLGIVVGLAEPAGGAVLKYEKEIGWASYRDLTSEQFAVKFAEYESSGYLMIDVDVYPSGSDMRYSMVWRKNTDGRGWAEHHDMSGASYGQRWREYKDMGYRPLDIESYRVGNQQRFAGIWVENREGLGWSSQRGMTSSDYDDYVTEQSDRGYRIIDVEVYATSSGLRYAAIWVQNSDNIQWAQRRGMTREAYQTEVDARGRNGYSVVDFESYRSGSGQLYAAIWERRPGYASRVRTNRTATAFANLWRQYADEGYRLVDFERYETGSGARYGGIWIENRSRFRYERKAQLDVIITDFREENELPGISVAVVRDGRMIYRRGFGLADRANQRVAHGGTIYSAASISKVIAGTIATKLQDEGRLRNGRAVSLDLTRSTRSYLTNVRQSNGNTVTLPARHTHTVAQVFAHLSCIQHYDGPEPASGHYVRAIDAVPQIWDAAFFPMCTVGVDREYSTHGYTYIAAVLEQVTGRTSAQLIRSEIAAPYGLSTMRAQWGSTTLPANYDRAIPYDNSDDATTYRDNSWKVFGGGIECSPVDLARFGWKVVAGQIVDARARDDIMWTRVRSNKLNGIAWAIRTVNRRRVAEHGGVQTGARSHLRIYRDEGLVIAIMSNRRGQSANSDAPVDVLATNIGDLVLSEPPRRRMDGRFRPLRDRLRRGLRRGLRRNLD